MDLSIDIIAPEVAPGIHLMPILHERVDLAALVRAVLGRLSPAAVAVELPTTLAGAAEKAVKRLPKISVVISEAPGEPALVWVAVPGDPLVEALRWAHENGCPAYLVDPDIPYKHRHRDPLPDPCVIWDLGPDRYIGAIRGLAETFDRTDSDALREQGMAHHVLHHFKQIGGPLLCLVGAAHERGVAKFLQGATAPPLARPRRQSVELRHLHPESLTALLPDPPLAHGVYEMLRTGALPEGVIFPQTVARRVELVAAGLRLITGEPPENARRRAEAISNWAAHHGSRPGPFGATVPDRRALGTIVWQIASASYHEQTRESTTRRQHQLFEDFARRYARIQGLFTPGLYEWVVAARGVADDNLAWEVFEVARAYPWQEESAEIPTARVDGDTLDLGTRKVRFRRRFFRVKKKPVMVPVRRRPHAADPAEWLAGFDGDSICSYPPEDIVIEDYGHFLQHKAISILAAENSHTEPFSTSLLDGIDIRETTRNWHEGTIWVRQLGRAPGGAGSIVVIFDDPPDPTAYPYLMTWLGEHDKESDMAFFATDPTQQIVGPGIMRATYGGFMLTNPPGRLWDVWNDADYRLAGSCSEVLIMAAIDYSEEKNVVHVATTPPASRVRDYASRQAKKVIHIPLGSLSPVTLRKLRVVHILAGKNKREIAGEYIW